MDCASYGGYLVMATRAEFLVQRNREMKEHSEMLKAACIEDSYMRGIHHIEAQACKRERTARKKISVLILMFLTRPPSEPL